MNACFLTVSALVLSETSNVNAQLADAGPDQEVCGTAATLAGNAVAPGETGMWSFASGCGLITDVNDPTSDMTSLCYGENVLEWSVSDDISTSIDNVSVWAYDPTAPDADAGADQTIIGPQSNAFMSASQPVWPQVCVWTIVAGSGTITNPIDPNTAVSGLTIGANTFRWVCNNGPCGVTSDDVVIWKSLPTGLNDQEQRPYAPFRFDQSTATLWIDANGRVTEMTLYNSDGKRISASSSTRSGAIEDLSGLPGGLYVLRALVDGHPRSFRFVVSR